MKKIATALLLFTFIINLKAQSTRVVDSLKSFGVMAKSDTTGVLMYITLSKSHNSKPDTGPQAQQKFNIPNNVHVLYIDPKSLSHSSAVLKNDQTRGSRLNMGRNFTNIGDVYSYDGDHRQAIAFFLKGKAILESLHDDSALIVNLTNLGNQYSFLGMPDSILVYRQRAYRLALKSKDIKQLIVTTRLLGEIYAAMHKTDIAIGYFHKSVFFSRHLDDSSNISETFLKMAQAFKQSGSSDSSLYYARWSYDISLHKHSAENILDASKFLTHYFKDHKHLDSAFRYQQITIIANDSLFSQEKTRQALQLSFSKRELQHDIATQAAAYKATIRFYIMLAVILFLLVLAAIFWRNSFKNQKAKKLLQLQKERIQITLGELETMQGQLIQSAKMASLGELTAGIAHEIQNPLNFVNNFSEVSVELLQELREEAEAGHTSDVIIIAIDLAQNLEKINYHGKRADSIVKGMLEHSRCGSGEREPANINAIADEFFKLSYHGIRAKDKSFSAELIEHLDKTLPKANIVQQDIGRVLANIFNNAFYAVQHKQKQAGEGYKPAVTLTTSSQNGQVTVKIKDNGDGIPDNIRDKIMQPFFTTKPSGEGTGLGLSLSYDIVVKGHGGSIMVDTKPGEFTEFAVSFPV